MGFSQSPSGANLTINQFITDLDTPVHPFTVIPGPPVLPPFTGTDTMPAILSDSGSMSSIQLSEQGADVMPTMLSDSGRLSVS